MARSNVVYTLVPDNNGLPTGGEPVSGVNPLITATGKTPLIQVCAFGDPDNGDYIAQVAPAHPANSVQALATRNIPVPASTIASNQIAVGTAAVKVSLSPVTAARFLIEIRNMGGTNIFLGPSTVTTGNGFQLEPGESRMWPIGPNTDLWGVGDAASGVIHVVEFA